MNVNLDLSNCCSLLFCSNFNRVEQTSASPNDFNAPSKSSINQNKNYYNTSAAVNNYNQQPYDPYYAVYEDELYTDIGIKI